MLLSREFLAILMFEGTYSTAIYIVSLSPTIFFLSHSFTLEKMSFNRLELFLQETDGAKLTNRLLLGFHTNDRSVGFDGFW